MSSVNELQGHTKQVIRSDNIPPHVNVMDAETHKFSTIYI